MHSVTIPTPPFYSKCETLKIHQIPSAFDNLIWLIEYEKGLAAAVDGPSAKEVLHYCTQNDLRLTTIINTHTHPDHIGINKDLQRRGLLSSLRVVGAAKRATDIPGITECVQHGSKLQLGPVTGKAFLTEGHINGHMSYLFSNILFCGDTLFTGGCGYLFDGPPSKMYHSLKLLSSFPDDTKICCAHEYTLDNLLFALSIEPHNANLQQRYSHSQKVCGLGGSVVPSNMLEEKHTNPFLRLDSKELQQSLQKHYEDLDTNDPIAVFTKCREHKNKKYYRN